MIEKMTFGDPFGEDMAFGSCHSDCMTFNENQCTGGYEQLTNRRADYLRDLQG